VPSFVANVVVNPYHATFDGQPHTAEGDVSGIFVDDSGSLDVTGTTHTSAGTYNDSWSFTDPGGVYSSSTGTVNDIIDPAATALTVSLSADASTFIAVVSNASTEVTPTGSVQFMLDGNIFGAPVALDANGTATISATPLDSSQHTITADYNNLDGNFSNSTGTFITASAQSDPSTTTSLTITSATTPNPAFTYGNVLTFKAAVTSTSTVNTGTVTFLDGSTTLATVNVSNGVATYKTTVSSPLSAGTHTITANYSDGSTFGSSSDSKSVTVTPAPLFVTANSLSKPEGNAISFAGTEFTIAGPAGSRTTTPILFNSDSVTSVTLTTSGSGASAEDGSYVITPSAAQGSGLSNYNITYVPGTLTVLEPAIVTSTSLSAINEGDASPVEVATFTHANGVESPGHFSAKVNWGISGHTADPGTISEDGSGTYHVTATPPPFTEDGSFTLSVTVSDNDSGPNITENFAALSANDDIALYGSFFIPPDQGSAVGPNHYMEMDNLSYAIYNKDGTTAVPRTTLSTFFANAGIPGLGTALSDPRLLYDQASGRWFAVLITTESNSNSIVLAVSQTSDPTGSWKAAKFVANTIPNNFADYPTIGVDQNALYIASNNFLNLSNFDGVSLTTIPKADLLNAAGPIVANRSHFENIVGGGTPGTTPFTLTPVSDFDGRGHGVIVATDGFTPATVIHRYDVTNSGSNSSTLSADNPIAVPTYRSAQNSHEPDGSRTLNANDFRLGSNNVYQVGNIIWAAQSILTSAATGNSAYDAIRWYEIDETTNTLLQSGTISDPHHDYLYPSIAANAAGDVVIGFSLTGDSTTLDFPGAWYVAGTTSGGVTTFGAPVELRNGSSDYSIVGSGRNRWGDFSAISVDPNNPNAFWIADETAVPGNPAFTTRTQVWGTQISELVFGTTASASSSLTVNEPAINGQSASLSTVAMGQAGANEEVATFTHANGVEPAGSFTAIVNWGIAGHTADPGTVTQDGSGTYHVSAARPVFTHPGTFTVTVSISEDNAATTVTDSQQVTASAFVLNPTLGGSLTVSGSGNLTMAGLIVVDSSASSALTALGNAQISGGSIQVVGGFFQSGNAVISPAPITNASSMADPLAGLPAFTGGASMQSVSLSSGTLTINPGIYTSISLSGTAQLILSPGVYVIAGGGLSVTGQASIATGSGFDSVTGHGVMIYNAGSNYPGTGGNFGGIGIAGKGTVSLTAPDQGIYAGIVIFQSRDNPRAIALSGQGAAVLSSDTVYAKAALLTISNQANINGAFVVDRLQISGNGGGTLVAAGSAGSDNNIGELASPDLTLYVNDPTGYLTGSELDRIQDAVTSWDAVLAPYSVTITETTDPTVANLVLTVDTTSPCGGLADGVLGCYGADQITIIEGWNFYDGSDPSAIGAGQYDFETLIFHELGHALGLGGSTDTNSVMYESLPTGLARRTPTASDLNVGDLEGKPDALLAFGAQARVAEQMAEKQFVAAAAKMDSLPSAGRPQFEIVVALNSGSGSLAASNDLPELSPRPGFSNRGIRVQAAATVSLATSEDAFRQLGLDVNGTSSAGAAAKSHTQRTGEPDLPVAGTNISDAALADWAKKEEQPPVGLSGRWASREVESLFENSGGLAENFAADAVFAAWAAGAGLVLTEEREEKQADSLRRPIQVR
jgi:hypothetical protein